VDAALDGVEGDGVVRWVGREDCDCIAGGEGVDGRFIGVGVAGGGVGGVGGEGDVEIVVGLADVLVEMVAWEGKSVGVCEGGDRVD